MGPLRIIPLIFNPPLCFTLAVLVVSSSPTHVNVTGLFGHITRWAPEVASMQYADLQSRLAAWGVSGDLQEASWTVVRSVWIMW